MGGIFRLLNSKPALNPKPLRPNSLKFQPVKISHVVDPLKIFGEELFRADYSLGVRGLGVQGFRGLGFRV